MEFDIKVLLLVTAAATRDDMWKCDRLTTDKPTTTARSGRPCSAGRDAARIEPQHGLAADRVAHQRAQQQMQHWQQVFSILRK